MRTKILIAGLAAAALTAGQAAASAVLVDTFDTDGPPVLNWAGDALFTSTGAPGSVDLIGAPPPFFDLSPGHGYYVDLDGSSGTGNDPAGQLTSTGVFGPGTYTLHFLLAGNLRGAPDQSTTVSLGDFSATLTPTATTDFVLHSFTFTTTQAGNLVFTEHGPSNQQGNLLDNVALSTGVPEPASWALMILGAVASDDEGAVNEEVSGRRADGVIGERRRILPSGRDVHVVLEVEPGSRVSGVGVEVRQLDAGHFAVERGVADVGLAIERHVGVKTDRVVPRVEEDRLRDAFVGGVRHEVERVVTDRVEAGRGGVVGGDRFAEGADRIAGVRAVADHDRGMTPEANVRAGAGIGPTYEPVLETAVRKKVHGGACAASNGEAGRSRGKGQKFHCIP